MTRRLVYRNWMTQQRFDDVLQPRAGAHRRGAGLPEPWMRIHDGRRVGRFTWTGRHYDFDVPVDGVIGAVIRSAFEIRRPTPLDFNRARRSVATVWEEGRIEPLVSLDIDRNRAIVAVVDGRDEIRTELDVPAGREVVVQASVAVSLAGRVTLAVRRHDRPSDTVTTVIDPLPGRGVVRTLSLGRARLRPWTFGFAQMNLRAVDVELEVRPQPTVDGPQVELPGECDAELQGFWRGAIDHWRAVINGAEQAGLVEDSEDIAAALGHAARLVQGGQPLGADAADLVRRLHDTGVLDLAEYPTFQLSAECEAALIDAIDRHGLFEQADSVAPLAESVQVLADALGWDQGAPR